jgi:hypothetical protein
MSRPIGFIAGAAAVAFSLLPTSLPSGIERWAAI